jgi:hypothetical protein
MSQQNREIVEQAFRAWNRGEFDAIVHRFGHEDIELHIVGGLSDLTGEVFAGRQAQTRSRRLPSSMTACA